MTNSDYAFTTIFDYAWLLSLFTVFNLIFANGANFWTVTLGITATVSWIAWREQFMFFWLGEKVAAVKRNYSLQSQDYYFVFQTSAIFVLEGWTSVEVGLFFIDKPLGFDWDTFRDVFLMFYVLQILKDIFSLSYIHKLMHDNWYFLHKTHHVVKANATSLLGFHIDVADLFIENVCAPFIMLGVQYALGYETRIHIVAIVLVGLLDAQIHSVNPYTVLLWNPILDYVFRCNVAHNLHHALNKGNYTFIPYHHITWSGRKFDLDRYNDLMKTTWAFY